MNDLKIFLKKFKSDTLLLSAPANQADIENLQNTFKISLPDDYKYFLYCSDGLQGHLGTLYLSLWSVNDILRLNALYAIQNRLGKNTLGIGTDGGDYCFLIDNSNGKSNLMVVPLNALDNDEKKYLSDNFTDGLLNIANGNITGDDL